MLMELGGETRGEGAEGEIQGVGRLHHSASPQEGALQRSKTSLRMKYEAEVKVTRKQIGDLESVRQKLGLSQRKMAQLLWVDPSAWHRWTRGGGDAPPHIYRALQWYLALNEKWPESTPSFWLGAVVRNHVQERPSNSAAEQMEALKREQEGLREEIDRLRSALNAPKQKLQVVLPLWGKILFLVQLGLSAGALWLWLSSKLAV